MAVNVVAVVSSLQFDSEEKGHAALAEAIALVDGTAVEEIQFYVYDPDLFEYIEGDYTVHFVSPFSVETVRELLAPWERKNQGTASAA